MAGGTREGSDAELAAAPSPAGAPGASGGGGGGLMGRLMSSGAAGFARALVSQNKRRFREVAAKFIIFTAH